MTEMEFIRISKFLKSRYGIDMTHKKEIVEGRLVNLMRKQGWESYTAYMNAVESDITGKLEAELVNILTTNHTYFMREAEHFEYLKRVVLPYLKQKEAVSKDLRIWCGAASSGEEPYALAMVLADYFGLEHPYWDTQILATDISTEVLQIALLGNYSAEQVAPLPENWKRRFLRSVDGGLRYQITEDLKKQVLFRQFNLMDPFPFRRKMHVIFLRNVMIYFDKETKKKLIEKVYNALEPGGYLFIGLTETIDRMEFPFEMVQPAVFRKIQ